MDINVSPIIDSDYYINQTDSYVADIRLGNSGKTVSRSGCYICAIATTVAWYLGDSSRSTKKSIVQELARDCNSSGAYLNSGLRYDGKRFKVEKISDMAHKLLDGYPAICEVPGHFVVINGYDTDRIWMGAYLVLDPGYSKHKTLQDTMDKKGEQIKNRRFVYEY